MERRSAEKFIEKELSELLLKHTTTADRKETAKANKVSYSTLDWTIRRYTPFTEKYQYPVKRLVNLAVSRINKNNEVDKPLLEAYL